jgi:hypothetical protein
MSEVTEEAVQYYTSKLIRQYRDKPIAVAEMSSINEFYLKIIPILTFFENFLDIDNAKYNWQLDLIGKIVGVDRNYIGATLPSNLNSFFRLHTSNSSGTLKSSPFFNNDYNTIVAYQAPFLQYNVEQSKTTLSNKIFAQLIKFKIIINNTKFFEKELEEALFKQYGNDIHILSTYNHDMYYIVKANLKNAITIAQNKGLLPTPQNIRKVLTINTAIPFIFFVSSTYNKNSNIAHLPSFLMPMGITQPAGCFLNYNLINA